MGMEDICKDGFNSMLFSNVLATQIFNTDSLLLIFTSEHHVSKERLLVLHWLFFYLNDGNDKPSYVNNCFNFARNDNAVRHKIQFIQFKKLCTGRISSYGDDIP